VDDYGRLFASPTFNYRTVHAAHFHDLFQLVGGLNFFHKDGDGTFHAALPVPIDRLRNGRLPLVDCQGEYGLWVRAVIENETVRNDPRPVMASGSELSLKEICDIMAKSELSERMSESSTHRRCRDRQSVQYQIDTSGRIHQSNASRHTRGCEGGSHRSVGTHIRVWL
jgi:hypothetical protein